MSNFDDSTGESADSVSVTEATFGGYQRKQVTAWDLVSPTANQQTAKNTGAIDFDAKTDSGTQTITHVFINDSSTLIVLKFFLNEKKLSISFNNLLKL